MSPYCGYNESKGKRMVSDTQQQLKIIKTIVRVAMSWRGVPWCVAIAMFGGLICHFFEAISMLGEIHHVPNAHFVLALFSPQGVGDCICLLCFVYGRSGLCSLSVACTLVMMAWIESTGRNELMQMVENMQLCKWWGSDWWYEQDEEVGITECKLYTGGMMNSSGGEERSGWMSVDKCG